MLWETFTIAGLIFIILEMVVPSMFFFNLAVAAIITALTAIWITNWPVLIIIFAVLSIVSILFLRPLLIKNKKDKEKPEGRQRRYSRNRRKQWQKRGNAPVSSDGLCGTEGDLGGLQ